MSKESVMMRDVICQFHPDFVNNPGLQSYALSHPQVFNVETLVEEALAAVGPYDHTDTALADFSDGSDSKTSTIGYITPKNGRGYIKNVVSSAGSYKEGALRCVIYNSYTESLLYYFLPKNVWMDMVTFDTGNNKGSIGFSWNQCTNRIAKFEANRCKTFDELAKKMA